MAGIEDKKKGAVEGEKKTRKKQGDKPLFHVFRIVDADGNVIPGAKVQTVVITRNAVTGMKALGENKDAIFDSTLKIA